MTLYSGKNGEIQRVGDFCLIFNETINMSDPVILPNPPGIANGNGRSGTTPPVVLSNNTAVPPPDTVKPNNKTGNNRNYIRKPPNKK